MAINRDSNGYTFLFATFMVVLVGGLLAFVSMSLKPIQKANTTNEKMQNILQAIGIEETGGINRDEAGKIFNDYVKRRITINYKGEVLSDLKPSDEIDPQNKLDAFNINLRKEYSKFIKPTMNANKGNDAVIKEEHLQKMITFTSHFLFVKIMDKSILLLHAVARDYGMIYGVTLDLNQTEPQSMGPFSIIKGKPQV